MNKLHGLSRKNRFVRLLRVFRVRLREKKSTFLLTVLDAELVVSEFRVMLTFLVK